MLSLLANGVSRSVGSHNSNLLLVADWVEAFVLFDAKEVSTTEVVDILMEEEIYEVQDYAREFVSDVWSELRRRRALIYSPTNLRIEEERLVCDEDWTSDPAYGFCLALSLAKGFPEWANSFGHDYTEQGLLFELLTVEALAALMPQWKAHKTGWSSASRNKLAAVVAEVVDKLYETRGAEVEQWLDTAANEAGLDVILYRDFKDATAGIPVFMLQCASGRDWDEKLNYPNLGTWRNIISFGSRPVKAFSMPYCLSSKELRMTAIKVKGPLFDRYRIFAARELNHAWPSDDLQGQLLDWSWPRVSALPYS